jgi:hypothetical protein
MIAFLAIFLATAFPSTSRISWMRPESFHLIVGMSRTDATRALKSSGWKMKKGDRPEEVVVDYDHDKTMTLVFGRDRLRSIRFELFTILHEAPGAFAEEAAYLRSVRGEPKKLKSNLVVLYDNSLPNVMVVLSADPKSEQAQKGIGMVVVRYFDPRFAETASR